MTGMRMLMRQGVRGAVGIGATGLGVSGAASLWD
jgi:hypothetical protein